MQTGTNLLEGEASGQGEKPSKLTKKQSVIFGENTIARIEWQVNEAQWERYRGNVSQYIVEATLERLAKDEAK